MRRLKHIWRTFYGWTLVPLMRPTGVLDADSKPLTEQVGTARKWTHAPGALLAGAPNSANGDASYYIVRRDRSARKITKERYDLLASLRPEDRLEAI